MWSTDSDAKDSPQQTNLCQIQPLALSDKRQQKHKASLKAVI